MKRIFLFAAPGPVLADPRILTAPGTQNVQPYEMTLEGKSIILYDTPGFDDSDGNDAQIFETIAQYLAGSLASKKLLNGAIFMQPINDARVPESERVRTELFKRIVGEDAYDHVVIASSMWDKTLKSFGERNERNRINDYDIWGEMLEGDARLMSFLNDYQSAKQIVRHFLYTPPVTMLLQKEIRDKKGVLSETSAGRWLEDAVGARVRDVEQKMMRFGATDKLKWSMEKLKGALSRLGKLIVRRRSWF